MNQRWQAGLSPFDGDCLLTHDIVTVEELRSLLSVVLTELLADYVTQTIYTFDDWHQHDGFVTERRVTDWCSLETLVRSADALIASRQGDTYVHRSFYAEELSFLLRFAIPEKDCGDGIGFSGTFDLSAKPPWFARILSLAPLNLQSRLRVEPSKTYFVTVLRERHVAQHNTMCPCFCSVSHRSQRFAHSSRTSPGAN